MTYNMMKNMCLDDSIAAMRLMGYRTFPWVPYGHPRLIARQRLTPLEHTHRITGLNFDLSIGVYAAAPHTA